MASKGATMLLTKIAEEMELMSRIDNWLTRSNHQEGTWSCLKERAEHEGAVRRFHSLSLGARFNFGNIQAMALTLALAGELRRLGAGPALLRSALKAASWPKAFESEAHELLKAVDAAVQVKD